MSSSSSSSARSMLTIIIIALLSVFMISTVNAYDPDPLQDFCVAVNDSMSGGVFVNGRFCKDPKTVTPDDFFFSGLVKADEEYKTGPTRSKVTRVNVEQLRGLNTLGIAISRIDYAPAGFRPPHVHPRSAEILHVIKGKLYAGFITSNPPNPNDSNKLYAKILGPGDVYCFPRGLVHFHYNLGGEDAVAFSTQGSQNAGVVTIATTVFGSDPPVNPDLLATSFQLNKTKILDLQSKEWTGYT